MTNQYPQEMIDVLGDDVFNANYRLAFYQTNGFTEDAFKDDDPSIRLEAYRLKGFSKEAFSDKYTNIRLAAYRTLGFTEEALNDVDWRIRHEANRYFETKALLDNLQKNEVKDSPYSKQMVQALGDKITDATYRLAFYQVNGFTEEAFKDENMFIRQEAKHYFEIKKLLDKLTQ